MSKYIKNGHKSRRKDNTKMDRNYAQVINTREHLSEFTCEKMLTLPSNEEYAKWTNENPFHTKWTSKMENFADTKCWQGCESNRNSPSLQEIVYIHKPALPPKLRTYSQRKSPHMPKELNRQEYFLQIICNSKQLANNLNACRWEYWNK